MENHQNLFLDAFHLPYESHGAGYLCNKTYSNLNIVQRLELERKLNIHNGCVNTICWSDNGRYVLSGSDDQKLIVTNPFTGKVVYSVQSGHRANIFSAKFMPNTREKRVVSCSGDGFIYYTNLEQPEDLHGFDCHFGTTYEVLTMPQDPHSFLSCGEDGTVRWFDLRIKDKCDKEDCKEDVLINCRRAVTAITTNPVAPYELAVGCSDSSVRIYDRRMLGTKSTGNYTGRGVLGMRSRFSAPGLENSHHRITSLSYSHDGTELLASYSSEHIYLFNLQENGKLKDFEDCSAGGARRKESSKQPPIKRLRLRGDWSDTGPNARPERERDNEGSDQAAATIMQRMSDMLTRWLEGANRRGEDPEGSPDVPSSDAAANRGAEGGEPSANQEPQEPSNRGPDSESILGGPLPCMSDNRAENVSNNEENQRSEPTGEETVPELATAACDTTEPCDSAASVEPSQNSAAVETESATEPTNREPANSTTNTDGSLTSSLFPSDMTPSSSYLAATEAQMAGSVVEPLVSLQYRSLGTCASTIRLDCRVRHNVDCLALAAEGETSPLDNEPESTAQEDVSVQRDLEDVVAETKEDGEVSPTPNNEPVTETKPCEVDSKLSEVPSDCVESAVEVADDNMTTSIASDNSERKDFSSMEEGSECDPECQRKGSVSMASVTSAEESLAEEQVATDTVTEDTVTVETEGCEDCEEARQQAETSEGQPEAAAETGAPESDGADVSVPGPSGHQSALGVGVRPGEGAEGGGDDAGEDGDGNDTVSAPPHGGLIVRQEETAERHAAARRLQELYRRRQETREREEQEMMQLPQPTVRAEYRGHRNARTMIKEATFWGRDFVMSGSDCGHVFVWDRYTTELVMLLEGDKHVVNCVQPHPYYPVLATSGIDYDVKLWTPKAPEPNFDDASAKEILRRNEVMLEETKDTITVPASFMLRMLASLNHFRSARRGAGVDGESSPSSEENDD